MYTLLIIYNCFSKLRKKRTKRKNRRRGSAKVMFSFNKSIPVSFPTFRLFESLQFVELVVTEIIFPGDVIVGVTSTFFIKSDLFVDRTIVERVMEVSNIVKKVDLALVHEKRHSNGMDWSITPPFVKKSTCFIQIFKILQVCWRVPEGQFSNFEVGPEMATVISETAIVRNPIHKIVLVQVAWMFLDETPCGFP